MPIVTQPEPEGARETVHEALGRRMPRAEFLTPLGGGAPETTSPLPLYNVGLDHALGPDPVANATLVGWRYPVVGGAQPGLAHLTAGPDGLTYGGLSHGAFPQRLLDATGVADQALGDAPESYEARLLQIPALRIFALWLAGERDHFVVLADGTTAEVSPLRMTDDIRPTIEAVRRDPPPQRAPTDPPTN